MRVSKGWGGLRRLAGAAVAAALLAGCGGGGDLIDPFRPARQIAFGDETSAITADGRNYGVNAVDATTGALVCTANPNWVQFLADRLGLVFPQCNPNGLVATGLMYAAPGAKVADVAAQIDAHLATDSIGATDLSTMLVGANDILELYAQFPATDEATLTEELRRRGALVAQQVERIAERDGRTIISTVPDLGVSPFAIAEEAANPGRAALLSRLTFAFNARMRATLRNDGRRIGIVLADDIVQVISRNPTLFGVPNASQSACTVAPPDCTTATLVEGASATTWLWAAPTLLSAGGHARLGTIAETRARNNPF